MTKEPKNKYTRDLTPSLVKSNLAIKELLFKRFADEGILYIEVVRHAQKNKRKITSAQLSRYLNTNYQVMGGLPETEILWLCKQYSIKISLNIEYLKEYK